MKRKTRVSPTKLSLDYLRKRGVECEIVERWVKTSQGGFRRDVWSADIQALTVTEIISIQAGTGAHHSEKIRKATSDPKVKLWLAAPTRIFWVMTWTQRVAHNANGARAKKLRWTPRVTQLSLRDGEIVATPFELRD